MVRFSNLSSPEYIMDLQAGKWCRSGAPRVEERERDREREKGNGKYGGARSLPDAPHLLPL